MAAVKDGQGRLCTGAEQIEKASSPYCSSVMKYLHQGVADCLMYLRGCDSTRRWSTTLPALWQEPDKDTVFTTLEKLDS